jgi:hypothetical protein
MDAMGLSDRDAFGAVVRRHNQVERVLCGHLHRPITARWAGTVAMTIPGVAHQVALDLRPSSDAALVLEPPAVALHLWTRDMGLISHLSPIPTAAAGSARALPADAAILEEASEADVLEQRIEVPLDDDRR